MPRRAYASGPEWLRLEGQGGALYACCGCGLEFDGDPGPVQPGPRPSVCPRCGSLYAKWTNYDEWRREHPLPPLVDIRE